MQLGMVGLGRMGRAIYARLTESAKAVLPNPPDKPNQRQDAITGLAYVKGKVYVATPVFDGATVEDVDEALGSLAKLLDQSIGTRSFGPA